MNLTVNILIGLPGSGKTTWLNNNFNPNSFFDELSIKEDGLSDSDFEKLRDLLYDDDIKEISISCVDFADLKNLYSSLTFLHNLIENTERKEKYSFILFPQSEAHCVKSIKTRDGDEGELENIRKYAPVIQKTFQHIKESFPKYVREIDFDNSVLVDELKLDSADIIDRTTEKKGLLSFLKRKL